MDNLYTHMSNIIAPSEVNQVSVGQSVSHKFYISFDKKLFFFINFFLLLHPLEIDNGSIE